MYCPRDGSALQLIAEYVGDLYEYHCPKCESSFEAFDDADGFIHLTETESGGQDRESYTDDQDRESYTVDREE